jgi:hypothetical protein
VNFLRLKGGGPKRQRLSEATEEFGKSESKRARISNVEQEDTVEKEGEEMHEQPADMDEDGAKQAELEAEVRYRGVQQRNSGRYTAAYKRKTIGTYDDAKHAALAYDLAVLQDTHTSGSKTHRTPILNFKTSIQVFEKESDAGRDPLEDIVRSFSTLEIPEETAVFKRQTPQRYIWRPMHEVQRMVHEENVCTQRGYRKWLQEKRQTDATVRVLYIPHTHIYILAYLYVRTTYPCIHTTCTYIHTTCTHIHTANLYVHTTCTYIHTAYPYVHTTYHI